jgi:hypothetical protein
VDAASRAHALNAGTLVAAPALPRGRLFALVLWTCIGVSVLLGAAQVHRFRTSSNTPAPHRAPTPLRALSDPMSVRITWTTPGWAKRHEIVTIDRLRTDRTLWRDMHFDDWDRVPPDVRYQSLRAMVRSYRHAFAGPTAWRQMTAAEWDYVPQPIRSMAYLRMIWHWADAEHVGVEFGLDSRVCAQTIGAIVMAESWFQHRALNENAWGNRDLGLAQCSDHCRARLGEMAALGAIPFTPEEDDYFNPWMATRIATLWFERELLRAGGDIDLAVRAYHRGLDHALDERGDAYLARVSRLREQYVRARGGSESWRWLAHEIRSLSMDGGG